MAELSSSVFVRSVLSTLPARLVPMADDAPLPPPLPLPLLPPVIFLPPAPPRLAASLHFEDAAQEQAYRAWTWARQAAPVRLGSALLAAAFVAVAAIDSSKAPTPLAATALLWTGAGIAIALAAWARATTPASPWRVANWSAVAASAITLGTLTRALFEYHTSSPSLALPFAAAIAAPLIMRSIFAVSAAHTLVSSATLLALVVVSLVIGRDSSTAGAAITITLLVAFSLLAFAAVAVSAFYSEAADRLVFLSHSTLQRVALADVGGRAAAAEGATRAAAAIACEVAARIEADGDLAFAAEVAASALPTDLVVTAATARAAHQRWAAAPLSGAVAGPSFFEGVSGESVDELVATIASAMGQLAAGAAAANEEVKINARYRRWLGADTAPVAPREGAADAGEADYVSLLAFVRRKPGGGIRVVGFETRVTRLVVEDRRRAHEFAGRASVAAGAQSADAALAWAAHELRAPSHNISTLMELLAQRSDLPADAHQDITDIATAAGDLRDLTSDLLDARVSSAADAPVVVRMTEGVDIRLLLAQLAQQFAASAAVPLVTFVDERLPRAITCDKRHLRQALANGLGNATKLTYSGCVVLRAVWVEAADGDDAAASSSVASSGGTSEDGLAPLQLAAAPAEDGVAPLPADEPTAEDGVAPLPAAGLATLPAAEPLRAACAVRFEVVDTGVGLGDVEPVALFGERVVGPSASASALEGSGLGLYIANKIMHALGGKIALFEETRPVPDAFDSCAHTFVPVVATRALHLPVYTNASSRVPSPAVRVAAFSAGGGESPELCAGAEGRLARPMFVPVGPWEMTNLGLAARLAQPPAIELAAPSGDASAKGAVKGGTIPVAAEEFEAAFYLLPATTSTRRCTVFSVTLPCPSAAASPASGAAGAVIPLLLLAPARTFPAAALGASLPPVTGPSVLCVRRRAAGAGAGGAPAADSSAAAQDANSAAMARLRLAFRRVLVCDDDAVCRRVSSHFLQLIILPSLGIAEDGLDALRAMLAGCPPTLLAAALLPGVHDAPDDESRTWLAGRNLPTTAAAALPWPYDLILLDVQMPNKHGDGTSRHARPQ